MPCCETGLGLMQRRGYQALGLLALACAGLGLLLPLLPTTVFLIAAAAAFARSSPRWEARLLAHPRFGPVLRDWRGEGAISASAKGLASAGMGLGLALFVWRTQPGWPLLLGVSALLLACAAYIWTRPLPSRSCAPSWHSRSSARPGAALLCVAVHVLVIAALLGVWQRAPLPVAASARPVSLMLLAEAAPPQPVREQIAKQLSVSAAVRTIAPLEPPVELVSIAPPAPQAATASPITAPHAPHAQAMPDAAPFAPSLPPAPELRGQGDASWEAKVLARLEHFRRYPAAARSLRQEGVVHLRLRLNRLGQVLSVTVAQSSGVAALDQAALHTVQRASPLPAIPAHLPAELSLSLPVEFSIPG